MPRVPVLRVHLPDREEMRGMTIEPGWDVFAADPDEDEEDEIWETRDLAMATYLSMFLPIRTIHTENDDRGPACWWGFDNTDELHRHLTLWEDGPITNVRTYERRYRQLKRSIYRTDAATELINEE